MDQVDGVSFLECANSLLVCGQLAEKLGRPAARQQIEDAKSLLADFDRQIEANDWKAREYVGLELPSV